MYIAFFDSGLGGLNTLKRAVVDLPNEKYIYFGDTANVPYGIKSPDEVRTLMDRVLDYLSVYDLKAFVIACNTATSAAAPVLRARHRFPIIGMEPAIKPAVEECAANGQRVMLMATLLTLQGEKIAGLKAKVDPDNLVDGLPCSELVEFAERLEFDQKMVEAFLREKLADCDLTRYGCVVLGSTHLNYFREAIANVFPTGTKIMDGNEGTVRHLAEVIHYDPRAEKPKDDREILLHLSDSTDQAKLELAANLIREVTDAPVKLI